MHVQFGDNNILTYTFLTNYVFNCRHRIGNSYTSVLGHIGVDFNGRFLGGCFDYKQMSLPKFKAELKIVCVMFRIFFNLW